MEKMLERTIRFAYRKAVALGADGVEAHETALGVLYDAQPDLGEYEAKATLSAMLGVEPDCRELQRA
jgi:hypothetical protein